ncbi:TonB-dependent siderophore receptor [Pseudorhodoferax sp.]|uniref:TonB-dependent siderophore receptor n=1 Tax=Pseudorhodoferax sp. TaxID=1993553 RepID=UPI002DD6AEB1|nr:TonB-dependent siderophore receptor [Pseudorhodoferax sp.]
MNNKATWPLGLFVLGTVFATDLSAQNAAAGEPTKEGAALGAVTIKGEREGYTAKESSSATRLNLSQRDTPQSLTVITRERLEDQNLTSLRQVLDNTPGLYSNAYDTERVLFYSRGFLVDTLTYDGVPVLPSYNTSSIDDSIDTALYERIEVVRGATGLTTGAGNPAASINLVRKHADSRTPTASLDFSLGSWQNRRVELDASAPLTADGRIRGRAVIVDESRDAYQDLYHKKTNVLYGIVDADLTPSTRLSLGADYQKNKPRGVTWGSFPIYYADGARINWPTSVTTAADWTSWNRSTLNTFAELRHKLDNGWSVQGSLRRKEYKEDVALLYLLGFPDRVTGEGVDAYAYRSKGKTTENALDLYASGPFSAFGRQHELVLGYNGSRAKNTGSEQGTVGDLSPTGNFLQWNGSYPEPAFADSVLVSDIRTHQDAAYAAARLQLADALKLIAGARLQRWKVDSYYLYDSNADGIAKYNYTKTIPYAGLVWALSPGFSAFTSYTGIFKPQNERDVSGRYLDPRDGHSVEFGIKGEHFNRALTTAFTVFDTRQNNVATAARDGDGNAILLPDGTTASVGVDGARTRGFEFEVAGRLGRNLQASFGWTRNVTKANGDSFRTFIPGTLVRSFLSWQPADWVPGLTLGGGVNWQSASSTTVASPDGATTLRQGSVPLVSLMARYQINSVASLQFNANNLLDRKYTVLDQYDNTYYGMPANYTVSLRLQY